MALTNTTSDDLAGFCGHKSMLQFILKNRINWDAVRSCSDFFLSFCFYFHSLHNIRPSFVCFAATAAHVCKLSGLLIAHTSISLQCEHKGLLSTWWHPWTRGFHACLFVSFMLVSSAALLLLARPWGHTLPHPAGSEGDGYIFSLKHKLVFVCTYRNIPISPPLLVSCYFMVEVSSCTIMFGSHAAMWVFMSTL